VLDRQGGVKAILLAAGYATRLMPLTASRPKVLLPVAGRPMLDWIADKIDAVESVDGLHVVTNAKFAAQLTAWGRGREGRLAPVVHEDGTMSNEDRLGAIGDIVFVVEQARLEGEDLLVVAGDNLFDFAFDDYVRFWRAKGVASAVALYDCGDIELARQYGVVSVEGDGRIVGFVEKPRIAPTTLVAIAAYLYHREHVALLGRYLEEGNSPDAPGSFIAWLHARAPVFGWRFTGDWFDIGDHGQLLVADNFWRARHGLPVRDEYAIEPQI
jgi:glucose-1-phosphate thymidylyltransferase